MNNKIIIISIIAIIIEFWIITTNKTTTKEFMVINDTEPTTMEVKIEKQPVIVEKAVKKTNNAQNNQNKGQKQVSKQVSASQGTYKLTHYGYDCCKSGLTATGWDARNIYYNDNEYGEIRIVAMCSKMPLYSIVKINNYKLGGDITAIVLDRGVNCSTIDLLTENEAKSSQLGIQKNVNVEILRSGK